MARSKVKHTYITNDALRKRTLKKRINGVMKKINELTTLCGVEGCVIVYDSKSEDSQPEIFPQSHTEVQKVVSKFFKMSKYNRTNKMQDQQSYLKSRIRKAKEQLMKIRRANREKEMTIRVDELVETMNVPENLSLVDLNDIAYVANQKIRDIDMRLNEMKKKEEEEMRQVMENFSVSSSYVPAPVDEEVYDNGGLEMILDANVKKDE